MMHCLVISNNIMLHMHESTLQYTIIHDHVSITLQTTAYMIKSSPSLSVMKTVHSSSPVMNCPGAEAVN